MNIFSRIFSSKDDTQYTYYVDDVDSDELNECKVGDYLTIWFPENKSLINLYRPGTGGGSGKVGRITGKFMKTVLNHFNRGDIVDAEILEIEGGKCKIICMVTKAEQIMFERNNRISIIKNELNKPYSPKKSLMFEIYTREDFELEVGESLILKFDPLNINDLNIEMIEIPICKQNIYIGKITSQTVCRKIVRAMKSGLALNPSVTKIEKKDKSLKLIRITISFK